MNKRIRELQAKRAALVKSASDLNNKVAAENRDMTTEEQAQFDQFRADMTGVDRQIEREEFLAEQARTAPAAASPIITDEHVRVEDDPKRGFRSFGDFARAVQAASLGGGTDDIRLRIGAAAPSTYGNESSGVDGGYAIPPEYAREIFTLSLGEDALLPMTDNTNVQGNSMVFPKDETTPWGTDGIRAYWQAEATAATATKPKLGTTTLRLHKLMALVPLTDELLADTNALNQYLPDKVGASIRWKTNEAIINGTGSGQPLGMFVGAAAVTQSKESGQSASTLNVQNVTNMIARLPPGSFPRSTWLITPDALPALFQMTLGNYPIYMPINSGVQGAPYGSLLGRPIMVSQHAAAFSSLGDVMLADMSYYRTITKAGGVETATSMHLYFDADATAFRTTFRIDGQPKIAAAISQAKGSNTLSPFVQLQAR